MADRLLDGCLKRSLLTPSACAALKALAALKDVTGMIGLAVSRADGAADGEGGGDEANASSSGGGSRISVVLDDEEEGGVIALGCGRSCVRTHPGATCLLCGEGWGRHSGHRCASGARGAFIELGSFAAEAQRREARRRRRLGPWPSERLSRKLAEQLSDPVVTAAGALPAWVAPLTAAVPCAFERTARRAYVAAASGGISRAIARLQVCTT